MKVKLKATLGLVDSSIPFGVTREHKIRTVHDVPDSAAKVLIERGLAEPFSEPDAPDEPSEPKPTTRRRRKSEPKGDE